MLESIETEMLGRQGLSFSIAAKRSQWEPENQASTCWRCAGSVGEFEADGDGCASCRAIKLPWDRALRLGRYEGIIKEAVLDLKFRRWRLTGSQLGAAFGAEIAARLGAMGLDPSEAVVVPIPITHRRRIRRGVDHTLVLAQGVSKSSGIGVAQLLRARKRDEQIRLNATDRTKNMRGAFFVTSSLQRRLEFLVSKDIRVIIVLDDVRTTGATLQEGCRVLKRALRGLNGDFRPEVWAGSISMASDERKGGMGKEGETDLSSKVGQIEQEVDA